MAARVDGLGTRREGRLRSRSPLRRRGERGRVPSHAGRAAVDGAHLSTGRGRSVSDRARSARRRMEREGSARRGTDGPRARGQRPAGGGHRYDARAGGAVPGLRAGRQLRRALAQVEGRVLEGRWFEDRRLRELQRRSRRRTPRHASARFALQCDSAAGGAAASTRRSRTSRCVHRSAIPTRASRTRSS